MRSPGGPARQRVLEQRERALSERRLRRVERLDVKPKRAASTTSGSIDLSGSSSNAGLKFLAVAGVLLLIFYSKTLLALQVFWDNDPNYSHGYLVPLVCGFFVWRAYTTYGSPQRDEVPQSELVTGWIELIAGFALHMLAWFINAPLLDVGALVGIAHGALMIVGGKEGSRPYAVACIYLLFMAPLPINLYQPMAVYLQDFVSNASVKMLHLMQIEAFREGNFVKVPGHEMEVGEACSGLRQLTAFLALSVAASHLSDRRKWYKFALILLAVPTAVAANTFRVALTGVIMMWFGSDKAKGMWHTMEGLAVFIVGIVFFLGFSWVLMKFDDMLLGDAKRKPNNDSPLPQGSSDTTTMPVLTAETTVIDLESRPVGPGERERESSASPQPA